MDTIEANKIAAAVLVAGIAFFMTGLIGDLLVHTSPLKEPAIKIDVAPAGGPRRRTRTGGSPAADRSAAREG